MRGAGYTGGDIYKGLRKELCVGATSISISTYQVLDDLGIPLLQVAEEGGHAHGAESEKAIAAATRRRDNYLCYRRVTASAHRRER